MAARSARIECLLRATDVPGISSLGSQQLVSNLRLLRGKVRKVLCGVEIVAHQRFPFSLSTEPPANLVEEGLRDRLGVMKHSLLQALAPADPMAAKDAVAKFSGPQEHVGYAVEWFMPEGLEEEADSVELAPPDVAAGAGVDLGALSHDELKQLCEAHKLPVAGKPAELIARLRRVLGGAGPGVPMYKVKIELPAEVMGWKELRDNLEGPDGSHFGHIAKEGEARRT